VPPNFGVEKDVKNGKKKDKKKIMLPLLAVLHDRGVSAMALNAEHHREGAVKARTAKGTSDRGVELLIETSSK
jgi:23S rRNA G2069 N7-methylase RlmK/C1962 C5-methylase RlmI